MVLAGFVGGERHIVEAGRGVAVGIGHQFHQQHAFVEVVRRGHAHACGGQPVQRIDFGALPGFFLLLAAVFAALGHGARLAAVLGFAVFGVVDGLAKAALVGFLVDLGAADVVAAAHDEHHRFLAAHELAHDVVDQTVFDQGFESFGNSCGDLGRGLGLPAGPAGLGWRAGSVPQRPCTLIEHERYHPRQPQ